MEYGFIFIRIQQYFTLVMAAYHTVTIVGTAGRSGPKLNSEIFQWMVDKARHTIEVVWGLKMTSVELVSGGAAWADHVAVHLFLKNYVPALTLHFPTSLAPTEFHTNSSGNWRTNPGRSANKYHAQFSRLTGIDPIAELHTAIDKGASSHVHEGFYARNKLVAQSDYLLAFTWGQGTVPLQGGTLHTWKQAHTAVKLHISLHDYLTLDSHPPPCSDDLEPPCKKQKSLDQFFKKML